MNTIATGGRILASRSGQAVFIALTGIIVARSLGPTGQGHFSLTVMVIVLVAAVLNGGMGLAAVPKLRRGEVSLVNMLRAQAVWIALVAVVVFVLGVIGSRNALAAIAVDRLGWNALTAVASCFAVVALLAFEIFFYDLLAEGRLVVGSVINLSRAILHLVIIGILLFGRGLDLEGAVAAYAVAQGYAAFTIVLLLLRHIRRRGGSGARIADEEGKAGNASGTTQVMTAWPLATLVGQNLRHGWVGQLSAVASLLHLRLDQALVSIFWSAAVVGVYSVAVQVGELLWLLSAALSPLLVYSSAALDSPAERDQQAARAVRVGLSATVVVALPLGLVAGPLLTFVFGESYAGSAPALRALLPGIVAFAPAAVLAGDFIGRGHPAWNAQASILTLVVNVACGLWLIPRHGAVGASWASTIAYSVGATVMLARFCRTTGLPLTEILLPRWDDFRR